MNDIHRKKHMCENEESKKEMTFHSVTLANVTNHEKIIYMETYCKCLKVLLFSLFMHNDVHVPVKEIKCK